MIIVSDNSTEMDVVLTAMSVVLVADSNNPTIINPDFLASNGILVEDLQLREPPITTPVFSQVIYQGGISIKAEPNRVIFEQVATGNALETGDIVSPQMAERYLEKVPHVPYSAIGINPKGIRYMADGKKEKLSLGLVNGGDWTSFRDLMPEIQLKAIYQYEKRQINLDIAEAKRQDTHNTEVFGLAFLANIHREIEQTPQKQRISELKSIIDSWEDDLADFFAIIQKFDFHRFTQS